MALKREEGAALAAGGDLYDAMLQDYEPGTTGAELEAMFGAMRPVWRAARRRAGGQSPAALPAHLTKARR